MQARELTLDVSDRRLQVLLPLETKIAADFSLVRAIFPFAGFGMTAAEEPSTAVLFISVQL